MEFIGVQFNQEQRREKTDKIWLCRMNRRLLLNFIKKGALFTSLNAYTVVVICECANSVVEMIEIIIDKMLFLRTIKGVKLLQTRFYAIMFLMQRQIKTFYDVVSIRRTVLQNENINQIDFCGGDVKSLSLANSFENDRIPILAKYITRLVCQ